MNFPFAVWRSDIVVQGRWFHNTEAGAGEGHFCYLNSPFVSEEKKSTPEPYFRKYPAPPVMRPTYHPGGYTSTTITEYGVTNEIRHEVHDMWFIVTGHGELGVKARLIVEADAGAGAGFARVFHFPLPGEPRDVARARIQAAQRAAAKQPLPLWVRLFAW
jgi:hypothetical protein